MHVFTVFHSIQFLEGLFERLQANGYECIVVSSDCTDEAVKNTIAGNEFKYLPLDISREISIIKDCKALIALIKTIKEQKPDIIHGHTPKAGLLSMLAGFICGIRNRVFHLHGLRYVTEKGIRRKIVYLLEKLTAGLSTNILAVSESLREFAIEKKICDREKITVIHNGSIKGIDIEQLENIFQRGKLYYRKKYDINMNKKIIGFVGRITHDKGIYDLISAIELLEFKRNDFEVIICGFIEEIDQNYLYLFNKFIRKDNVRYLGFVSKPLEVMMCFDILVLPTYREGFGLVNIEANGLGVPVITTNTIGCLDSIAEGVTGILVPVGDVTAIKNAIETLLDNPSIAEYYGANGRKRVRELYDRKIIWTELIKYYESLIVGSNG